MDVIRSHMASQITSLMIVYTTVYSGADKKKNIKAPRLLPLAGNSPVTGEFSAQRASNAENVSIWKRHHVVSNYIRCFEWDVNTHQCTYFNGGVIKPPLKLVHGCVIASHFFTSMRLLVHTMIPILVYQIYVHGRDPSNVPNIYVFSDVHANIISTRSNRCTMHDPKMTQLII